MKNLRKDHSSQLIFMTADQRLAIDENIIEEIFGRDEVENQTWIGLTEDYNDLDGPFDAINPVFINSETYLKDFYFYRGKSSHQDVLEKMIAFFEEAKAHHQKIQALEIGE